jgi:hypothetical protein
MTERHISQRQIVTVLRSPDRIFRGYGNALVANKKFDKQILGVVFVKKGKDFKIITCYWR